MTTDTDLTVDNLPK